MMTISPDGATLAWRKTQPGGDAIIIFSTAQKRPLGGVTIDDSINPSRLFWATPDKLILVASEHTRIAGFRGKHDVSAAWVYDLASGKLKPLLTPGDHVYRGQTGLGRIVGLSPDGQDVYMPAYFGEADVTSNPNYVLFQVNLERPLRPRMAFKGNSRSLDFLVDATGEVLVHEFYEGNSERHVIAARNGKDWKTVYSLEEPLPRVSLVGLTEDRSAMVLGTFDDATRRRSYFTRSLVGEPEQHPLFARTDADVEAVYTDINRVVHGARYSGFTPHYEFLDPTITRRLERMAALAPGNSVWLTDWTHDWKTLLVFLEGPQFSGQYYLLAEGREPEFLANARPGFDDNSIHPVIEFAYKAADGLKIPALLTIPRSATQPLKNLPAVVVPHGGPAAYDAIGFDWFVQGLADQGYLVLQPQFRGSTGFGLDHQRAGHGEWGGKMQSDLVDGINALVKKGYVDPDRICIAGMSYGGYAALAGGAFDPDRYRCIVSINGVSDLKRLVDHEAYWSSHNQTTKAYLAQTLGGGEIDRKRLDEISPAEHASAFNAPVLLIHSEDDEVVSIEQSTRMASRLKSAGRDVTLVKLPDDGHGLVSYTNRVRTMRETVDFINRQIGVH